MHPSASAGGCTRAWFADSKEGVVPQPVEDTRNSTCALCGELVDLREEHYRLVSKFRVHRSAVHVECYAKLRRERGR